MLRNSSNILFFKNYPRIVMSCFQGSMGSTSRGVKNVFKKARNVLKKLNQQKEEMSKIEMDLLDLVVFKQIP